MADVTFVKATENVKTPSKRTDIQQYADKWISKEFPNLKALTNTTDVVTQKDLDSVIADFNLTWYNKVTNLMSLPKKEFAAVSSNNTISDVDKETTISIAILSCTCLVLTYSEFLIKFQTRLIMYDVVPATTVMNRVSDAMSYILSLLPV